MIERKVEDAEYEEIKPLANKWLTYFGTIFCVIFALTFLTMSTLCIDIFLSFDLTDPIELLFANFVILLLIVTLSIGIFLAVGFVFLIRESYKVATMDQILLIFDEGYYFEPSKKKRKPNKVKITTWNDVDVIYFDREVNTTKVEYEIKIILKDGSEPKGIKTDKFKEIMFLFIKRAPGKVDHSVYTYLNTNRTPDSVFFKNSRTKEKHKEKGKLLFVEDEVLFLDRQFFLKRTGFWVWFVILFYGISSMIFGIYFSENVQEIMIVCAFFGLFSLIPGVAMYYYLFMADKAPNKYFENGVEIYHKKDSPKYREYSEFISILVTGKKKKRRYELKSRLKIDPNIKIPFKDPGIKENIKKIRDSIKRFRKMEHTKNRKIYKKRVSKPAVKEHPKFGKYWFEERDSLFDQRDRGIKKTMIVVPLMSLEVAGVVILLGLYYSGLDWLSIIIILCSFGIFTALITISLFISLKIQKKPRVYSNGIVIKKKGKETLIPYSRFNTIQYDIAQARNRTVRIGHSWHTIAFVFSMKNPKARYYMPMIEEKILRNKK